MNQSIRYSNWKIWRGLTPAAISTLLLLGCYSGTDAGLGEGNEAGESDSFGGGEGGEGGEGGGGEGGGPGGPGSSDRVPTPLARLTNEEFLNSAKALINLPEDVALVGDAEDILGAEPIIRGLANDANNQLLTQVAIAGYSAIAQAVADTYLDGVTNTEEFANRLECDEISEGMYDLAACTRDFAQDLLGRAVRRDPTDAELSEIVSMLDDLDTVLADSPDGPDALSAHVLRVRTILRSVLLSPDFLLIVERGVEDEGSDPFAPRRLTSFEIATRLAYFITGSLPDDALLQAARDDLLADPDIRLEHTHRLLSSPTGEKQFTNTLLNWLGVQSEAVGTEAFTELAAFLGDWFVEEKPFRDFYQAPISVEHVDGEVTEEPFGVLGMQAFLASHTSHPTPGFITRGVFVVESLLCGELPAGIPDDAIGGSDDTALEVFENHAKQPCATCHVLFDNYGAAFQQFDTETALFDRNATELGSGFELWDLGGISGTVDDVADLGEVFGSSERAPDCMAELWYRHALRRGFAGAAGDRKALNLLVDAWQETGNTSMKSLLRTIVTSEDFITLFP